MLTAIRSRTRTVLTVVALLLTMALVVAALLFAVQWVFPAHTHTYRSYDLEVTPSSPWHTGQSLSLQWVPGYSAIGGPNEPPQPPRSVTYTFALYGPYPTQAAAQQAIQFGPTPGGGAPIAASAPPLALSTDLGAPTPPPLAYALPDALALGYYVAVGSADGGDVVGGWSGAWVAEVAT